MFSLCISNEKKFQHHTKGTITVVPVFVEFHSIYSLDSDGGSNMKNQSKIDNSNNAGIELLHTVASLYYKNLPDTPLSVIYETLCKEGVKTLLLLRHGEEILNEWRKYGSDSKENAQVSSSTADPLLEKESINYGCESKLISPDELTCSSVSSGFPCKDSFASPSVEEMSMISSCSKTFSSGIISELEDLECDKISSPGETETQERRDSNFNPYKPQYHHHESPSFSSSSPSSLFHSNSKENKPEKRKSQESGQFDTKNLEFKIRHCFCDDLEDESTYDDNQWNDQLDDKLTELLKSGSIFLDEVKYRREERLKIINESPKQLNLDKVAIEHRIIGSISFHKDYRLPSMPIIFIDWLIVRDSYRSSKIGSYLIKKIKSSSLVGSYHLMCVNCPTKQSINFFRSLNFTYDDLSECRLRPLLPKQFTGLTPSGSSLLFYYPSFNYSPSSSLSSPSSILSTTSSNIFNCEPCQFDLSIKSISDEIRFWRERSLEAYHDQITMVMRLKSEIVKLHNQLKSRDRQLNEMKQENQELRHIVTQSNAMAAISTIDEIGSLFESIKELCSVVR